MSRHGNYGWLHYSEAIAIAEERDEILVTADDVLMIGEGGAAAVAIHIVAGPNFWEHDEPEGYSVELVRPFWMYGSEGHLYPVRWVGRVHELTNAELDAMTEDDPYWELIPEHGSYLWAVPKVPQFSKTYYGGKPWKRCELKWWDAFRQPSAQVAT